MDSQSTLGLDATRWSRSLGLGVRCHIDKGAIQMSPLASDAMSHEQQAAICMSILDQVRRELAKGGVLPLRFSVKRPQSSAELIAAFEISDNEQTLVIRKR